MSAAERIKKWRSKESNHSAENERQGAKLILEKMSEEENEKRLKFEYEVCAKTLDYLALVVFVSLFIMITLAYIAATMSHSVLHHQ